ncbi:hypothetical protein B0A48_16792 [Cryoendolithus antarcticus]|uniref:Uncharacterized protein n=1 Tax=Cryoendolithus antarcticus TaxID=1507870 RepID=A0A1V8SE62_9PEZI|nr:hypothetical protein B0A48_16792 [Cryoendolithus antarcticus]
MAPKLKHQYAYTGSEMATFSAAQPGDQAAPSPPTVESPMLTSTPAPVAIMRAPTNTQPQQNDTTIQDASELPTGPEDTRPSADLPPRLSPLASSEFCDPLAADGVEQPAPRPDQASRLPATHIPSCASDLSPQKPALLGLTT